MAMYAVIIRYPNPDSHSDIEHSLIENSLSCEAFPCRSAEKDILSMGGKAQTRDSHSVAQQGRCCDFPCAILPGGVTRACPQVLEEYEALEKGNVAHRLYSSSMAGNKVRRRPRRPRAAARSGLVDH
jgi:hypothetical protein